MAIATLRNRESVCLQTFPRSMIGRGVHVTIAEDILKVNYTKFKENLLFTFRGKTFCYDIFIVYHS